MSDPFQKMEYNKKSLLALFVQLAKADNIIDDNEVAFIDEVRNKLGVSIETLDDIWENDNQYPLTPPDSEKHRMTILHQLLLLMNIDGDVAAEETQFVRHIGKRLRIRTDLVDSLIDIVEKHNGEHLSTDDIIQSMQKLLN